MACSLTPTFFREKLLVNMPQSGLCDKKVLLVENRNHVWRDLSRLVDSEYKWSVFDSKAYFRIEVVCDLKMPQSGLCDMKKNAVGRKQEPCVEGSLQVS